MCPVSNVSALRHLVQAQGIAKVAKAAERGSTATKRHCQITTVSSRLVHLSNCS